MIDISVQRANLYFVEKYIQNEEKSRSKINV